VDTDLPLKRLFSHRAADLLVLTGDEGATVEDAEAVEVPAMSRRPDCVLKLNRAGECLSGLPVLTTVIFLRPPGPVGEPVFRLELQGSEINCWRFEWVRLWERDAGWALAQGGVGALVLLPLMKNESLERIEEAARRIRRSAPRGQQPDLLAALNIFAGGRYTAEQLARLVGRELMIESSFWEWARSEGRAEGQLLAERELCLAMVLAYHPALLPELRPQIEICDDAERLKGWVLQAPRLSAAAFKGLFGPHPRPRGARRSH
jgi:hypothetical protein